MSSTKNQISLTDRVKTFEDACSILGPNNFTVNLYNEYICRPKQYLGEICKIQLAIICEALNERWKPEFTVGEVTYQPAISVFFPKMNTAGIENLHTILHYNKGVVYQKMKDYIQSEACFKMAILCNPLHQNSHLQLGISYLRQYYFI